MRFKFKPNCRIRLQIEESGGTFASKFMRGKRRVGSGQVEIEGETILLDGKVIFDFYNLANRNVLDGRRWKVIDANGITYNVEYADVLTGRLVRAIATVDPTASTIDLSPIEFGLHPNPFHGIVRDTLLGIDANHSFGFRV